MAITRIDYIKNTAIDSAITSLEAHPVGVKQIVIIWEDDNRELFCSHVGQVHNLLGMLEICKHSILHNEA